MTLTNVTYVDGRSEFVLVIPADLVEFERKYGPMEAVEPYLTEHSLYPAYCATLRLSRRNVGSFNRWMETVASVEAEEE